MRQKSQQIKPFKKDDSVEKDTSDLNLKTEEFKIEEDTREWGDMDLSNIYKEDEMETETKSTPPKLKLKSPSLNMKKKKIKIKTKRIVKVCTNNDWQSYDTYEPYLLRNNKPVKYSRYPSDLYLTEDPQQKINWSIKVKQTIIMTRYLYCEKCILVLKNEQDFERKLFRCFSTGFSVGLRKFLSSFTRKKSKC